jgi:hypothetical protein
MTDGPKCDPEPGIGVAKCKKCGWIVAAYIPIEFRKCKNRFGCAEERKK